MLAETVRDSPGFFWRFPGNYVHVFPFFLGKKGNTYMAEASFSAYVLAF